MDFGCQKQNNDIFKVLSNKILASKKYASNRRTYGLNTTDNMHSLWH